MNYAEIAAWSKPAAQLSAHVTTALAATLTTTLILAPKVALAVPLASEAQLNACTNAVIFRLNGVPRSAITTTAGSLAADGTGRVNWSTTNGGSGVCWVDSANQVLEVEVAVHAGITQTPRPITRPIMTSVTAGTSLQVATNGGNLNVRSGPGGEIVGSVADGSTVVLTGKTSDEWVEIEGGGWVSQHHLVSGNASAATPSNSEAAAPTVSPGTAARKAEVMASGGVNIRNSPDGEIIASIPQGTTVVLTGQVERGWVELVDGGWVAQEYLQYR